MKFSNQSLALVAFFSSLSAFAMPKVGDVANYVTETKVAGTTTKTKQTQEITAYDAASDTYTVKLTTTLPDGSSQTEMQPTPAADLPTEDLIKETMANCGLIGGKKEKVKIGSANVDTCKVVIADEDSGYSTSLWTGLVPFGNVRIESKDTESSAVIRLESFKFAP